jgi:S-adenosylmethionine hydrolase
LNNIGYFWHYKIRSFSGRLITFSSKYFPRGMPIITLTTDWNRDDYYLGATKGKILSECQDATIVDITHKVPPFNISQAAFIVRNTIEHYPKGTIHLIGVNIENDDDQSLVVVDYQEQYLVCCDNGILGLIMTNAQGRVWILDHNEKESTFPFLSVLVPAACSLAKGKEPGQLGKELKNFNKQVPIRATIDDSIITGSVIYIDSYQNAITNVSADLFKRIGKSRKFEILIQSNHYRVSKISKHYNDQPVGEIVVLFNSLKLLEVSINKGNAAELLNLRQGSNIRIRFKEE